MQTVIHPQYDPTKIINDIAILKLESPVQFSSTVRPVCLPNINHNFDNRDVSTTTKQQLRTIFLRTFLFVFPSSIQAIVAGWGLVKEGGVTSNYLQEAIVPIISNSQCRETRYKSKITDVMLCAGLVKTGGKDACQGDSGGPLIVNEGRYKLAGEWKSVSLISRSPKRSII